MFTSSISNNKNKPNVLIDGNKRLLDIQKDASAMKPDSFLLHYERLLPDLNIRSILEIGVHKGGGLKLWRSFFGDKLQLIGIDYNAECKTFEPYPANRIHIGSQEDLEFLNEVKEQYNDGFDLIIDDGSHINRHVINTFILFFDLIRPGGCYVIEDVFTSYWKTYGGGIKRPDSIIELFKIIIDEIYYKHLGQATFRHHECSSKDIERNHSFTATISSIEFISDGILVIRKCK